MRPDNTFIQGLYFDNKTGLFWEGSGMWGASKVRFLKLDPETKNLNYDATVPQFVMGGNIFGEGICPLNENQIVVLTWKNNVVYILNQATLQVEQTLSMFTGAKEGWGVTNFNHPISKNNMLYVSDGTDKIFEINGDTLKTVNAISVKDEIGNPVTELNELEYSGGLIWANIWYSNDIIAIDPKSG